MIIIAIFKIYFVKVTCRIVIYIKYLRFDLNLYFIERQLIVYTTYKYIYIVLAYYFIL